MGMGGTTEETEDVGSTVSAAERGEYSQAAASHRAKRIRLSEEITSPYNRPFPFHRLMLCPTQRTFPFSAGVVLIQQRVSNLKVAVGCAIETPCIPGTSKLLRWGLTDRANERHR
jgi:hypothetical protein